MAIAFKDWDVVCEALGTGVQDVILRKGGIHEGVEGFRFENDSFYLFPTLFHAQVEMVSEDLASLPVCSKSKWELGDVVEVKYFCEVKRVVTLVDWGDVLALAGRHILREEVVRERFDWAGKGMSEGSIHVAFVETRRLEKVKEVVYDRSMGGCRSWIEI